MTKETKQDVFDELLEITGNAMNQAMSAQYPSDENGWMQTKSRHHISTVTNSASYRVSQADIDTAPDWVKAIKPVEVRDEQA